MITASDRELVQSARDGSAQAFAEIVRRHQSAVRNFVRRVTSGDMGADDIAQETFVLAFARLDSFRMESTLRSWLCGIAYRKALTAQRGARRRSAREAAAEAPTDAIGKSQPERRLDVEKALNMLSCEQRPAAALCLGAGFSHSEAAAALGIPLGTLKSRVASARRILTEFLEAYR